MRKGGQVAERAPRVSIGTPVYNGENFLSAAGEAILAQTFTDFEWVISDNGSTDATEAICRAFAARDPRVRYHREARNRGGAWNRNRVFALSTGAYFMWHDHDDAIAPEFIARCVEVLDRLPEVVACHTNATIIDERGARLRDYAECAHFRSASAYTRLQEYIRHDRDCPLCSLYFGLMRREVLGRTRLFQPYVNAELSLMSELALRGQFYEIPAHLFYRRDHPGISTRHYANRKELIAWSDPSRAGKGGGDGWRMLGALVRSITVVPMGPYDRARCYLSVLDFFGHLAGGSIRDYLAQRRPPPERARAIQQHVDM